jgi:hypothetical protein
MKHDRRRARAQRLPLAEQGVSPNFAAGALVAALTSVDQLEGFRRGLAATITYTEVHADPSNPAHAEALEALRVWQALEQLVLAVQSNRAWRPR